MSELVDGDPADATESDTDAGGFRCPFCQYVMETDDRYGCPNCLGQGLDHGSPWRSRGQ